MNSTTTDRGRTHASRQRASPRPSRRGGSGRVLTDVIVDLGFVDAAVDGRRDRARPRGRLGAPSASCSTHGTLTDDQLARAVAERFGLDHLDLALYRVDPDAAKLVTPAAVKRYQAVPGVVRPATARCWSRWPTRPTCSRSTTSRS